MTLNARVGICAAAAVAIIAMACASIGPPPGAPEMKTPPQLVAVTPDSGEVNVQPQSVVFRFSESINDRPSRGELNQYFVISPMAGAPDVTWRHDRLLVRPTRGFRPNTAYTITMLPGLSNFRGGAMTVGHKIVFSTGATMPSLGIFGRVFDWQAGRPLANAVVEAISRPDSIVYLAVSDSAGGFVLGPFDRGDYSVIAFADANHNLSLDRGEPWDSLRIAVTNTRPLIELDAITRDTIAPRITTVTAADSVTLDVKFDRALDPSRVPVLGDVTVQRADSAPLTLVSVMSDIAVDRARTDSLTRADSLRAAQDTTHKVDQSTGTGHAIAPELPKPRLPAPPTGLRIKLSPATPVQPKSIYKITVRDATGITGRSITSARVLTTPAPAPRDTTTKAAHPTTPDSLKPRIPLPGQPPGSKQDQPTRPPR